MRDYLAGAGTATLSVMAFFAATHVTAFIVDAAQFVTTVQF
ncbi:MAG: hypothetical protein AAF569_07275 [Pseudomonadota bacterium]